MSQRNEVVVGCDGSEHGWVALDWALQYAGERNAAVVVTFGGADGRADEAEKVVEDALRRCEVAGVEARGDLSNASAESSLVTASEGALALVVGATGHGGLGGALWGSVSRHVTRHADVPTIVARKPARPTATKVVVGIDGTPVGEAALRFALEIASRRGWDVEALHAADAPGSWKSWTQDVTPEQAAREDAVERLLSELTAGVREEYPEVALETSVARLDAGEALRDASDVAALVVVGAHGREGVTRFLGSVSQAVALQAHCPVAVLH